MMLLFFALLLFSSLTFPSEANLKEYIVHVCTFVNMGLTSNKDILEYYHSFLPKTNIMDTSERGMIHTYLHAMSGFSARLTKDEVNEMAKKEGFLRAQPSGFLNMLTTHTPEFLGLKQGSGMWNMSQMGKGMIIGLIDSASGIAPLAHIAIYKVCDEKTCEEHDIIAGMDAAIGDGVDVISISLGNEYSFDFYIDGIAIATYRAAKNGIFVSCAGGNFGPGKSTVKNVAPWVLTVAAGTMDRRIEAIVKLGDGREFEGQSLFQPHQFPSTLLPLTYPSDKDGDCIYGNLKDIKGKMVLCYISIDFEIIDISSQIRSYGGVAMILMSEETDGYTTHADVHVLPASNVNYADTSKILAYFNSSTNATATIVFKGTVIGKSTAPTIASFSSRGPNFLIPGVLKPDILGPGVDVLAAWPHLVGPTADASIDHRGFNVMSDWSPAAIKSAIMTTSMITDHDGKPIMDEQLHPANSFMMGAGHVNPSKAFDPGLVFDVDHKEYIALLCGMKYKDKDVSLIVGENIQCSKIHSISQSELNYPSIVLSRKQCVKVNRTVTNVGKAMSTYKLEIDMPDEGMVKVVPNVLKFNKLNEKQSYMVSIVNSNDESKNNSTVFGNLRWVADEYTVRTPIVIVDHFDE
ncbi:hypothetical protein J5N97_021677 [Dioscorea zingiberensis]|uniref:Uncharacterized protein n=1 Tax=Dioscorea zingiberensis TaxID=325984 RepID=A0A9D5CAF9_9LILI|nr:hypothetical protein J5N97_021677 [Dioscorea zingiberensis]